MAYDPLDGEIVLFGGLGPQGRLMRDTWTWNGTDWTRLSPTHRPLARWRVAMTSWSHALLFGGLGKAGVALGDTCAWNGDDWVHRSSVHAPVPRYLSAMAFDEVRGREVLFGGAGSQSDLGDTWTWGDGDWKLHLAGSLLTTPHAGDPGSQVQIDGWGFARTETVDISFIDSVHGSTPLGTATASASGGFSTDVTIPASATPGRQEIQAVGRSSGQTAEQGFRVR
jgi:hypothetical protein